MNVQQAPQEQPVEVEQLVEALVDGQLAKYLLDTDTANELIKELAAETGLPRAALRIGFKLLVPILVKRTQTGAGWFTQRLLAKSADVLVVVPGYSLTARKLMALRARLDADLQRRQQLDAILAGERPATDIDHAESLSKELRIGLRQLGELAEIRDHIDARFDEVLDRLNPQPPLTLKLIEGSDTNRLKFGARRVPFLGRQVEMERLRAFLNIDKPFSWWLMTGSGGQGKSRLALEFCLRAGTAWRAGFLPETSQFSHWDNWQPESATLIVVDYVAGRPEQVRRIITTLLHREQTDPLDAPVRLLLLERSKESSWWDKLISNDQTGYAIEHSQFDIEPLDLCPMTEDDLWQGIASILTDSGKALPDRAETLAAVRQIDPEGRPLFAAFAADALVSGSNIRQWDRERLLRDVLHRERTFHWIPAGVTKPYENVLCLATMTGGLRLEMFSNPPPGIEVPKFEEFDLGLYQGMIGLPTSSGGDGGLSLLPSLQPDILAEFFVLEHLKPAHARTKQPAETFLHVTWNMPTAHTRQFWGFLNRCKDDFLDHQTLRLLLEPLSVNRHQRQLWARLALNLTVAYGDRGQLAEAAALVAQLKQLAVDYQDETEIRHRLAQSAVNLIKAYDHTGQFGESEGYLTLLQELIVDHPDEAQLRDALARGTFNLVTAYGNAGQFAEAERCLAALRQLTSDHPDDARVRFELAKGAVNLTTPYGSAGQFAEAEACLVLLRQLATDHLDDAQVRFELALGAFNLIIAYARAGQPNEAERHLALLKQLETDHRDEAELRLELARGAVGLINAYSDAGQFAEAETCLALLKQLKADNPGEVQVRLWLANGAYILMNGYAKAGQLVEAEGHLVLLQQLEADHPDEAELRLCLAQSAVNVIKACNRAGQFEESEGSLALLKQLSANHPEEDEVRFELAKGARNLITAYASGGRLVEAEEWLTLLKRLEADHPHEAKLRLQLANGALNLLNAYGNRLQFAEAMPCLTLLILLEANHGDEAELRLQLANGAYNLITAYRYVGRQDEARRIALESQHALMSPEFEKALRQDIGEEAAERSLTSLRSLLTE
jgi:Tetratricopeptide repeat/PPR repeat